MDEYKTLEIYNRDSEKYCRGWLEQNHPEQMYETFRKYFHKKGRTADIGSGSGRDVHWLNSHGYVCEGYDASEGLLEFAKKTFPQYCFQIDRLPDLKTISNESYENVVCETVLMHLPQAWHIECLKNLLRILKPQGVLALSWRHAEDLSSGRDADGRLYEKVDSDSLRSFAHAEGSKVLEQSTYVSAASSKLITQMTFQK